MLLAHVYAAALRYYGSPAHVESSPDPVGDLDTGDVAVVPGFTGRLLKRFDPDATARADEQVYRSMVSALPEGVAAGDYTQSAQDKPALAVTETTARSVGRRDVTALVANCGGLKVGAVTGASDPAAVGACQIARAARISRHRNAVRGIAGRAASTPRGRRPPRRTCPTTPSCCPTARR